MKGRFLCSPTFHFPIYRALEKGVSHGLKIAWDGKLTITVLCWFLRTYSSLSFSISSRFPYLCACAVWVHGVYFHTNAEASLLNINHFPQLRYFYMNSIWTPFFNTFHPSVNVYWKLWLLLIKYAYRLFRIRCSHVVHTYTRTEKKTKSKGNI